MSRFTRRLVLIAAVVLCLVMVFAIPVLADGPNLLQNPSFERPYVPMAIKENCRIAAPWVPYYYEGAPYETAQGYRLAPEYKAAFYWEAPGNRVRSGELSQQYFHSYGNFEGGIYQQVSGVRAGQLLRFEIYALVWSCDNQSKGNCGNSTSGDPSPMHLRIGIDPTGGTDAKSANIIWSAEQDAYDAWTLLQVEAVAAKSSVTVFVYSYPDYRSQDNNVYLDDASLVAASARLTPEVAPAPIVEPTPTPAAAPSAPAVVSEWPRTGSLLGNRGGSFARIPLIFASSTPVTLVLHVLPYDMIIANGAGFTLYGPNGMAVTAEKVGVKNEMRVSFTPVVGVEYLVQVFNYLDGFPVTYKLSK
ncbi:MAG: hypothetical protein ACYCZF_17090 [Anaerolineae bacterium]